MALVVLAAVFLLLLPARAAPQPPLRTVGRHLVDATGRRVFLACVNWYGAHLEQLAANGLNQRSADDIAATIASFGFNCVRLPFSLDLVIGKRTQVPEPEVSLAANPSLQDRSPLEVFDATVAALTKQGIMVILNNHVSGNGWCCTVTDGEGLWYTSAYPEKLWLEGLGVMSRRYEHDPLVVGFDLRNELRPSALGAPSWGDGNAASDWSMAAVKGAKRVLTENKNMLIIVSGLYFSIFLCDVPREPIHVTVPELRGRTIYTSHEYSWVNFHLVVRYWVGAYLAILAAWCLGLWLLALLGSALARRSCPGRCCGRLARWPKPREGSGRRELCVALVISALSLLGLWAASWGLNRCGLWNLASNMLVFFLALFCSLVSLVLWMRLAVLFARRTRTRPVEEADLAARRIEANQGDRPASTSDCQLAELALSGEATGSATLRCGAQGLGTSPAQGTGGRRRSRLGKVVHLAASGRCLVFSVAAVAFGLLTYLCHAFGRYEAFASELDGRWGFLVQRNSGGGGEAAPVWIGEFGTRDDDLWWQYTLRYIREREVVGWAYWAFNGEQRNNVSEHFGLTLEDSLTVRHPWKLQALQELMHHVQPGPDRSTAPGTVLK